MRVYLNNLIDEVLNMYEITSNKSFSLGEGIYEIENIIKL